MANKVNGPYVKFFADSVQYTSDAAQKNIDDLSASDADQKKLSVLCLLRPKQLPS